MLDIKIKTFLTVCECNSYTEAAKRLFITQPAVSQQIKMLEKYYRTKLFYSSGKKMYLTDTGLLLKDAMINIQHDTLRLQKNIIERTSEYKVLYFGATRTVAGYLLPDPISQYIQKFPKIKIQMLADNTENLLKLLREGMIDFAIVEGYFNKGAYDAYSYGKEDFVFVCHPDNPLSEGEWSLGDILKEPLILREAGSGSRKILESILYKENYNFQDFGRQTELADISAIKKVVSNGVGITALYRFAVKKELEEGSLKTIDIKEGPYQHGINFIWRKNSLFKDKYYEIYEALKWE